MLRRIVGLLVVGSLFAIGYVTVNGLGDDYQLFGDAGMVLSGWRVAGTALAILVGLGAFPLVKESAKARVVLAAAAVAAIVCFSAAQSTSAVASSTDIASPWTAEWWASQLHDGSTSSMSYEQAKCAGTTIVALVPTKARFDALAPSERDYLLQAVARNCPKSRY